MKNYQLIDHDVFFIAQRIKEIDKSYFIVLNFAKGKYEVHSLAQKDISYCFTVPFDSLDERTLFYALKTRSENVEKLIEEIDKQNQKLQKDNFKKAVNKLEEVFL